jgi:hypothetical protein
VVQTYLLGFPLVALWVLLQISRTKDDDLSVLLAVSFVYALIWPIALPLDLGHFIFKRFRKTFKGSVDAPKLFR